MLSTRMPSMNAADKNDLHELSTRMIWTHCRYECYRHTHCRHECSRRMYDDTNAIGTADTNAIDNTMPSLTQCTRPHHRRHHHLLNVRCHIIVVLSYSMYDATSSSSSSPTQCTMPTERSFAVIRRGIVHLGRGDVAASYIESDSDDSHFETLD